MPSYIDADVLEAYIKDYACIPCKEYGADRNGTRCDFCGFGFCLDGIKRHTVHDAEPVRHGRWIFNPKDAIEMMFTLPKCSECGAESSDGGNYCPNCGAKMEEVEA